MTSFKLTAFLTVLIAASVIGGEAGSALAAPVSAGHTIITAGSVKIGLTTGGGGGAVDFYRLKLDGGDQVQFAVTDPAGENYEFQLYAPETTDATFASAKSIMTGTSGNSHSSSSVRLRAPYNGTFVLAVCENRPSADYTCQTPDDGLGQVPMDAYSFVPRITSGPAAAVAARETRAAATVAKAAPLGVGRFESGGGGHVDFWRVALNRGDTVKFAVATPSGGNYLFQLFPAGTTDKDFGVARAVYRGATGGNVASAGFSLKTPSTGTYLLAACENMPGNYYSCVDVRKGRGNDPMDPYTFKTALTGGRESVTAVTLSAASVRYGHERTVRFSVSVKPEFGGQAATGKVGLSDGKKTVCVVTLAHGQGSCRPSSATAVAPGQYAVRAFYAGDSLASKSGAVAFTVSR